MTNESMSANDLRDRTDDELVSFVQEKSEELFKLRFQHYTGQLENTARLKLLRREIARARTIITERGSGIVVEMKSNTGAGEIEPKAPAADNDAAATQAEEEEE